MGADPANNIDPTGGAVPGLGCPSVIGMSGFGGSFVGAVNSSLNIGKAMISTVVKLSTLVLNGASAVNTGAHRRTLHAAASNKSSLTDAESVVGDDGGGGGDRGIFFNEGSEEDEDFLTPKIWYYVLKTEGGPHSLVYDPENNMIYETNHPTVNGEAVNGRENWKAGGYKSQGYAYDMSDEDDKKDFWEFMGGRGTLLLSPVVVLKPERATAFFERNKGKEWNYNIAVNNCKHYVLQGLTAGAALIPPLEYTNPLPFSWPMPYTKFWNSTMTKPQSVLKILTK